MVAGICIIDILPLEDLRVWTKEFDNANTKEINGLLNKRAYKIVEERDVPHAAKIIGGRLVLTIKNVCSKD